MKSYVRNTINLSCAKILLTSVISEFSAGLVRKRYLGVHQVGVILVRLLANYRMSVDCGKSPLRCMGDGRLQILCKDVDKFCSVC